MPNNKNNKDNQTPIFERIKNGDERAYEQLFKENYVHLVAFANSFIHDIDNAENIVQNVFVKLWENRKQYNISSINGYLMIAVRNSCNNEIKRIQHERVYQKSIEHEELIDNIKFSDSRIMDRISAIINQLPEQRRKIFKLNRLEGLKYREIATKLNISPKTVEIQMGKALKFLRENLIELKKQVYHMLW